MPSLLVNPSNAQSNQGLPCALPSRLKVMALAPVLVLAGPRQAAAKCNSNASRLAGSVMSKWPQAVSILDGPFTCTVLNQSTQSCASRRMSTV
ncbi:hypothetical protein D3C81_817730 [compost metagenome]